MLLSLIAALDRRGAIGKGNALPWHLPRVLRRFKALALGKPVLGWAHGGAGELLAELYPHGAVPPGDTAAAQARAAALLAGAPRPGPVPYTLAAMQERTLALYRSLAAGGAP